MKDRFMIYPKEKPEERLVPGFFPEKMDHSLGANFADVRIPGQNSSAHQFVSGNDKTISFELLFDDEPREWKASAAVDAQLWLEMHVPPYKRVPSFTVGHELRIRPVHRIVLHKSRQAWDVIIRSVDYNIEKYSEDGTPRRLRAKFQVTRHTDLAFTNGWKRQQGTPKVFNLQETSMFANVPGDFAGHTLTEVAKPGTAGAGLAAELRRKYIAKVGKLSRKTR